MESKRVIINCVSCGQELGVISYLKDGKWQPNRTDCPACAFKRLATARVNKVLKALELLENLGSGQYIKSDADVAKIKRAITDKADSALAALESNKAKVKQGFTL
jgi:DNA-directed RNA polymerase subunit RPC12/RpoP